MQRQSRSGRILTVTALCAVLSLAAAGTATGKTTVTSSVGAPVATLPFTGTGTVEGTGTGKKAPKAYDKAVAKACNDGTAIGAPQWYQLPPAHGQKVVASVDAPYVTTGRGPEQNPSGTAFVDSRTGAVLSCDGGTTRVTTARPVSVVAFYRFTPQPCDPEAEDCYWRDGDLRLLVSPTTGAAPANDLQSTATPIGALPFTGTADTSLADDDGGAGEVIDLDHCLLSAIDPDLLGTVWWRYTATSSGPLPAVSVDLGTPWSTATARAPQAFVGLVTDSGVVPVPRQSEDPWDCESPQVMEAGKTYLFGIGTFHDAYYEATLLNGAPVTLRVGPVATPGAPAGVFVTTDSRGRATASWAAPQASGATPVTAYRVVLDRRLPTGGWGAVTAVKLPATATSWRSAALSPTESYRVRVRAMNSGGPGTPVDTLVWTGR